MLIATIAVVIGISFVMTKALRGRTLSVLTDSEASTLPLWNSAVIPDESYLRWKQQVLSSGWKMQTGAHFARSRDRHA